MRRFPLLALLALFLLQADVVHAQNGFYRAQNGQILDGEGRPVLLRGLGLGGWLVPEGYMLHFPGFGSPSSIRQQVVDVVGPAYADSFFTRYEHHYVREADIAAIASWGFDHLRLPLHYRPLIDLETGTFKEEGFARIDTFLAWSRRHGLRVILDLHAAPGGQNAGNISDSDGTARLWTEPNRYQPPTIALWAEIARRYADDPWIIGYDLINEPVLPSGVSGQQLRNLYLRLTEAVREVDPNHILFIEGNNWATDFSMLEPAFDANMAYAFHKYWNSTSQSTIQYLIDLRARTGVPLWLGESGENSNQWFTEVIRVMEDNQIGWNWWTHKKMNTVTSPLSSSLPSGFQRLIDYWNGRAAKPDAATARRLLFEYAANLDIERSTLRPDVLAALLDRSLLTTTRPYRALTVPGVVDAVDYDMGMNSRAYLDTAFKNESGTPGISNQGGQYRNDGVDIERSSDTQGAAYNIGWTDRREWMAYTVDVQTDGTYDIDFRVAALATGGTIDVSLGTTTLVNDLPVPSTGGYQNWRTVTAQGVHLPAGKQTLKVVVSSPGFNFNRMTFRLVTATDTETPEALPGPRLLGAFPNPAPADVRIRFVTAAPAAVGLTVFDLLGRTVYQTPDATVPAGANELVWPAGEAGAGVYFYRLTLATGPSHSMLGGKMVVTR